MTGRRRFVLAGAAMAAGATGLSGCANPARIPAPVVPPPPPMVRVGDRWRYARINRYNGQPLPDLRMRVTAVEPLIRVEVSDGDGREFPAETYTGAWNVVQETVWEQAQVFDPPCPLLPQRLAPGEAGHWRGTYQVAGDSWRYAWSVRIDAHDWERIEVPAGVFEALRITRRIAFVHPSFLRAASSRMETLWYAPAVRRWVRRETDGEYVIPGRPPMRGREDRVGWVLVAYDPAGR